MDQSDFDDIQDNTTEYAYGPTIRLTADHEWSESELETNIYDECYKSQEFKKCECAMYDRNMLLPDYMATVIVDSYDVVDTYNREADKDRSKYGIAMFDKWIYAEIKRQLELSKVVK